MVVRQMRSVGNPLLLGKVLIERWGGEGGELGFRKSRRVAGEVTELGRGRGEGAEAALVLPEYWTLIGQHPAEDRLLTPI